MASSSRIPPPRCIECGADGACFWRVLAAATGRDIWDIKEATLNAFTPADWETLRVLIEGDFDAPGGGEMSHWRSVVDRMRRATTPWSAVRFAAVARSHLFMPYMEVDPVTVMVAFAALQLDAVVTTHEANGRINIYDIARGTERHAGRSIVWMVYLVREGHYRLMEYAGRRLFTEPNTQLHPALLSQIRVLNPGWLAAACSPQ